VQGILLAIEMGGVSKKQEAWPLPSGSLHYTCGEPIYKHIKDINTKKITNNTRPLQCIN